MLIQQTLTKLHSLKLSGMAQGFEGQLSNAAAQIGRESCRERV